MISFFSHWSDKTTVKRYKQVILSNFFVTDDGSGMRHLVEANLDIESRSDRTLCTEILTGNCNYEVLVNGHLAKVCVICAAILERRISNMPVERKANGNRTEEFLSPPDAQLCLPGLPREQKTVRPLLTATAVKQQSEQIELFVLKPR